MGRPPAPAAPKARKEGWPKARKEGSPKARNAGWPKAGWSRASGQSRRPRPARQASSGASFGQASASATDLSRQNGLQKPITRPSISASESAATGRPE